MRSNFSNYLKVLLLYVKKVRYNKNVGVFLIFLILSTIFWLLNELEDVYVSNISYPVKYTDPPKEKVFVGDLHSQLDLKIEGTGFNLLEYRIGKQLMPIEFSVNSYDLNTIGEGQEEKYYILTNSIRSSLAQQLSSDLNILDISPDTLFFQFAKETQKKLPVVSTIDYSFDKQLMLKGDISIEPDSVTVIGPTKILDTISEIKTEHKKLEGITQTTFITVPLKKHHSQLQYSVKTVNITIPVEQFTEGEMRKELVVKNLPDSVVLRTFPRTIRITYLVGLSNYENLIPELFKATVDYKDIEKDSDKIPVKIEKTPDYLKSYSYNPHKVDYIIEKKDD